MTPEDQHPPEPEEGLSETDADAVRRLLAAARPGPMPRDVVHRLDDVLASLQTERLDSHQGTATGSSAVADLTKRRTRRWPKVLVAAAAVSVVGVGIGNVMNDLGSGSGESATSGAADGGSMAREQSGADDARDQDGGSAEGPGPVPGKAAVQSLPRLRTRSVTADAARILAFHHGFTANPDAPRPMSEREATSCEPPRLARGDEAVAVRLDGRRATLVFRAAQQERRDVEVYACDDAGSPLVTTTVDAR